MARKPRNDVPDSIHHVFDRGNGKQNIFLDNADFSFFLRRLNTLRLELNFRLFALCLMDNHFHLVLQCGKVPMHKIMQRLLTAHARVFNDRWRKVGHTFQGRYGNRPIASDGDMMGVIRYVHMNPVAAGVATTPEEWRWSGHHEVIMGIPTLLDVPFVAGLFGGIEAYRTFLTQPLPREERPMLEHIAGSSADLVRGRDKTSASSSLRREFIEKALNCGYRRSEIATYLGRSPSAITQLLAKIT